jgi:hypothetical protein
VTKEPSHDWPLGEILVRSEVVALTAQVGPLYRSGFSLVSGDPDYDLTASFRFVIGAGDVHETAVWFVFHPKLGDPTGFQWSADLRDRQC